MDQEFYLNFLYNQIKNNLLEERVKIVKKLNEQVIEENQIIKKKSNSKITICQIKLSNNKILLVEDLPLNFLLAQTIFIGDKIKLKTFKIKNKKFEFIADEKIVKKLGTIVTQNTVKEMAVEELFNLKFSFTFEQPKILIEFKNYILKKTKIDLGRIHIIDSKSIELFLPNIRNSHLKIAQYLKLPTISFIKNSFIKDTSINVFDIENQIKLIKPLIVYENQIIQNYERRTNQKLYLDLVNSIVLKLDINPIIKKITDCPKVNFNKEKIIEKIKNKKEIEISTTNKFDIKNNKNLLLPLFRSIKSGKFVKIKNLKEFSEITGLKYKEDLSYLKNIHIQTINGEKARFVELYLNKKTRNMIEFLIKNKTKNNILFFSNFNELILKLLDSNEILTGIIKKEEISSQKILQYNHLIKKIFQLVLIETINFNNLPKKQRATKPTELYFLSIFNSMYFSYNTYQKYPIKIKLLNEIILRLNNVLLVLKNIKISYGDLYFINQIVLLSIKLFEEFNLDLSYKLKHFFNEYFKSTTLHLYLKTKININIEHFMLDVANCNKLSKKKSLILIIKKPIPKNLISPRVKLLYGEMPHKVYIKPNYTKLIKVFPYSYAEVGEIIKKSNIDITYAINKIKFKDKEIKIDKSYFTYYYSYPKYKVLTENPYFKTLIKKH